jgi:AAA15 family ATPase/GTPase
LIKSSKKIAHEETGIVQRLLLTKRFWKIIFELSKSLNIQVFDTTHSEDCIFGSQNVLNSPENPLKGKGKLIRLDDVNGEIKPVEYSPSELKIANDHNIETR